MRLASRALTLLVLCGATVAVHAQAVPANRAAAVVPPASATQARKLPGDQRVEQVHLEDSGAVIDELRVGGETRSMTVRPKSGLPAYEILPVDGKSRHPSLVREGAPASTGERVWKVLSF